MKGRGTTRRRIAVITGTRAEYGLLKTVMQAIDVHPRLTLQVVVTGMHLLRKFGRTLRAIQRDGRRIDARVPMQRGDDDPLDQALGLSRGVAGIARFIEQAKTDVVLVLGDRIEAMAGALAAVTTGRFLAHVHGGDLAPGDIDDSLRHSITKLAHLHLTATKDAARRIMRMGEPKDRVRCVGAPGLDRLYELIRAAPGSRREGGALIVQHACGRPASIERRAMEMTLSAVERAGLSRTILYPNSDRGHEGVIEAIQAHRAAAANGAVRVFRALDRDDYLRRLIEAAVVVGNSSSGIIEAAVAGTPAVNIGPRQTGRARSGPGVIDAVESAPAIRRAIHTALARRPITPRRSPYGEGRAGPRIAEALAAMPLTETFRRKLNAY
jgi:UDP-hydrolysing UDP-N-acetyl-D-glucosamine 2-epimerase